MRYAIKNLREAEDFAPRFGYGEVQEARFPYRELGTQQIGFAYYVFKPGRRQAFAHRHKEAEEVYVILRGTGSVKLDDELREVGPMDAIRVEPTVARGFEAGPEGLEVLAFGARHEGDGEMVGNDEFWGD